MHAFRHPVRRPPQHGLRDQPVRHHDPRHRRLPDHLAPDGVPRRADLRGADERLPGFVGAHRRHADRHVLPGAPETASPDLTPASANAGDLDAGGTPKFNGV